jgi:hypothetical protein
METMSGETNKFELLDEFVFMVSLIVEGEPRDYDGVDHFEDGEYYNVAEALYERLKSHRAKGCSTIPWPISWKQAAVLRDRAYSIEDANWIEEKPLIQKRLKKLINKLEDWEVNDLIRKGAGKKKSSCKFRSIYVSIDSSGIKICRVLTSKGQELTAPEMSELNCDDEVMSFLKKKFVNSCLPYKPGKANTYRFTREMLNEFGEKFSLDEFLTVKNLTKTKTKSPFALEMERMNKEIGE